MPQFLNILLQKNDSNLSWGFEVAGGGRAGVPLIITKVHPNSFCSQYLSPEDRIIRIEGIDVELLSEAEALSFVTKPGRSLNLLVHKRAPTICHQHHRGDDASSESSTSSSGTALRHDNLRSSFRSYFDRKYDAHRDSPSSPSGSVPPETRQTPPSPRFASRWSRDPTSTPPNNDLRGNRGVHWWDTGASSSSYSSSALEDSENERSYDEFRLGPDDEVDFGGGFQQATRSWPPKGLGIGSSNESVGANSADLSTGATHKTFTHSTGEPTSQVKSRRAYTVRSVRSDDDDRRNISRVYLSPFGAKINLNDPSICRNFDEIGRQPSQTADKSVIPPAPPLNGTCTVPVTNNIVVTPPPAPPAPSVSPAPPPPPPPALNGGMIPTIRLKSEIPERPEPPAKLQNAMMKDKKPFTYTPGGIDLSEIKSPRMARRVMRNAQEPEDKVLPTTTSTPVNAASLPPSAIAAMCPQIAIPVFPQNSLADRKPLNSHRNGHVMQTPPPPPPKQPTPASSPTPPSRPAPTASPTHNSVTIQNGGVIAENKPKTVSTPSNLNRPQVGTIYVPPVSETDSGKSKPSTPTFPTLREAPTPWLNKHQQQQPAENVPPWRTRNSQDRVTKDVEQEYKPGPVQIKVNMEPESNKSTNGGRVIPIQIEGAAPKINQSKRWGNAKDNNETAQSTINNRAAESEPKPIQSRSFKVLQKITGSEDDSTDGPYSSEGVPLSQLRKLHLNDDDQAFMNKVKAQGKFYDNGDAESFSTESNYSDDFVDEDTFLHMETDPRYRGSVIPSRAFRMLQNMTDSGQVTSNNVVVIPINQTNNTNYNQTKQSHPVRSTVEVHVAPSQPVAVQQDIETKRNYIPPSERQAEQDLRKYMGSSIPSRSFRMLQAMTATQDSTENVDEIATNIDEENVLSHKIPFLPNPWTFPPERPADVISLWKNYRILYDFVFQQLPHLLVENCSGDSIIPSHLHPMKVDPQNSTNIAIVVTDEENSNTRTALNAQNPVQRPTSPGRRLKPYFHSEIIDPHEPKKALIITQTLTDGSDNDVSVTVRIPLRRRPSTPTDFHSEITLAKEFLAGNAKNRSNGAKVMPIEYPTRSEVSHDNHKTEISSKISEDNIKESTKPSHIRNLSNIVRVHSGLATKNNKESNKDTLDSQMHSSHENGFNTNNRHQIDSTQFSDQNGIDSDSSTPSNSSKINNLHRSLHTQHVLESNNFNKYHSSNESKIESNSQHSTQSACAKFQTENGEDSPMVSSSRSFDGTNRSQQFQDPTLLKASDPQSESSSEDLDSSDDHSDASSVDFWKEIAENEEDLFFKTSKSKSTSQSADEKSKPVWNLGKDVRDFCNYTELSDSTDTSSNSSSDQNKDSFDKSNPNETSSCSSDESYNVYDFNEDKLPDDRPSREDIKSEFIHLDDDLKKGGTDVDEDSGMNSDTGRNCSETEAESEAAIGQDLLKPSIKYERARTHSRLYRLLQAEEKKTGNGYNASKQSLMLPLNGNLSFVESISSSSGINSPMSPVVSEKLVNELVQNVLKWKNGPDLSKFSIEKLREIAIRSLQGEGTDSSRGSSPYSPFLMANEPETADTPRHFDFTNPTKELADSNALYYPGFDLFPSPAFKTLQSGRNSPKTWPKCPLVNKSRSYLTKQTSLQNGTSKR